MDGSLMKEVLVYTMDDCSYCTKAKNLLSMLDIPFEERDVIDSNVVFKTVPQIFLGETHIGGFTDLRDKVKNWFWTQ